MLKEDVVKLKGDIQIKNVTIESNIGTINTLEEKLKEQIRRVKILELAVNRYLQESSTHTDSKELSKFKSDLKSKNEIIRKLTEDKSALANELKELQDKFHGEQEQDMIDKCIRLTADVNKLKSDNKLLERENKKLVDTHASLQEKFNDINNKLAEVQVNNVRLSEYNTQLYDLVKGSKLKDHLEEEHNKDKDEQSEVYRDESKKESKQTVTKSPRKRNFNKKFRFFENGSCKKNPCNYVHPEEACVSFSSYGQCQNGHACTLKTPSQYLHAVLEWVM